MSTITMKDGTAIYYKDWGSKDAQPIVFHHGWPLSADDWDTQMLYFVERGYRVIAHDRRGHGRSSQVSDGHDMDHYAADAAAALLATDCVVPRTEIEFALERAEHLVASIEGRARSPRILELRGRLAAAVGDAPSSDRTLREALDLYRAIGATGHAERLARKARCMNCQPSSLGEIRCKAGGGVSGLACSSPGPARSTREEAAHVRCGIGFWRGQCLSLADYVTMRGPTDRAPAAGGC